MISKNKPIPNPQMSMTNHTCNFFKTKQRLIPLTQIFLLRNFYVLNSRFFSKIRILLLGMLKTILSQSSNKTFFLADRLQSELRSRLALALIKSDLQKSSQVLVIETGSYPFSSITYFLRSEKKRGLPQNSFCQRCARF